MQVVPAQTLVAADISAATPPFEPVEIVSRTAPMMGGRVGVHLSPATDFGPRDAAAEADAVLHRIDAWAARLTRFTTTSELSRLNDDPRAEVPVSPTLAAVLDWGRSAEGLTGGIVDIGLLDARLSAEREPGAAGARLAARNASPGSRAWSLDRRARGAIMRRPVGLRFDLDGIGKGWLADRSLGRLGRHPASVVDADGDISVRLEPGMAWCFGVADPRRDDHDLAMVRLTPRGGQDWRLAGSFDGHFGLATSGTSVHRWTHDGRPTHHLIDPRTGRSAETDVVQATVLARTAREAEALAKATVILGSVAGYDLLERSRVDGAILLTDRDELVIHPDTLRWLT